MKKITRQQARVLKFVIDYIAIHGYSPARSEIARHLGQKNLGNASHLLRRLEAAGRITLAFNVERGIEVLT